MQVTRFAPMRYCMTFRTSDKCSGLALRIPALSEQLGPNLVANGSFEDGGGSWGWASKDAAKATMTIDDSVAHSGKCSARLHSEMAFAPHVFGGLSQVIAAVAPESEYVIRLWAKGKSVGVCWFGGGPQWLSRQQLPRGDFGWTLVELRWRAPDTPTDHIGGALDRRREEVDRRLRPDQGGGAWLLCARLPPMAPVSQRRSSTAIVRPATGCPDRRRRRRR